MLVMTLALRPAEQTSDLFRSLLIAGGVLIGLVLVGAVVLVYLKRWAEPGDETEADVPFSLEDLRQMYISGQLNDEEYAIAREKVIALSRQVMGAADAYDEDDYELGEELIGPDNNAENGGQEPETT